MKRAVVQAEHDALMEWTLEKEPDVPKKFGLAHKEHRKVLPRNKPAGIAHVPIAGWGKFH